MSSEIDPRQKRLTPEIIAEIIDARNDGMKILTAAKLFGVSRETIRRYAPGERSKKKAKTRIVPPRLNGRPSRCTNCGAIVRPPCVACQVRAFQNKK